MNIYETGHLECSKNTRSNVFVTLSKHSRHVLYFCSLGSRSDFLLFLSLFSLWRESVWAESPSTWSARPWEETWLEFMPPVTRLLCAASRSSVQQVCSSCVSDLFSSSIIISNTSTFSRKVWNQCISEGYFWKWVIIVK